MEVQGAVDGMLDRVRHGEMFSQGRSKKQVAISLGIQR